MFKRFFSRRRQKIGLLAHTSWHLRQFTRRKAKVLAQILQSRSQKMSTRELKWWFAGFCLMGLLSSSLLLITTLSSPSTATPTYVPERQHRVKTNIYRTDTTGKFEDYRQIIRIELYLDSLQKKSFRNKAINSFLKQHPGLLDSIRFYKRFYGPVNPEK